MSHKSRSRVQGNLTCVSLLVWVESCSSRASRNIPKVGPCPSRASDLCKRSLGGSDLCNDSSGFV
jgi:hypothetical protein